MDEAKKLSLYYDMLFYSTSQWKPVLNTAGKSDNLADEKYQEEGTSSDCAEKI